MLRCQRRRGDEPGKATDGRIKAGFLEIPGLQAIGKRQGLAVVYKWAPPFSPSTEDDTRRHALCALDRFMTGRYSYAATLHRRVTGICHKLTADFTHAAAPPAHNPNDYLNMMLFS